MRFEPSRPGNGLSSLSLSIAYKPIGFDEVDWVYRHMISALGRFDPKMEIDAHQFNRSDSKITLEDFFVQDFPLSRNNPDMGALYAEPLVKWKSLCIIKSLDDYQNPKFLINRKAFDANWGLRNRLTILRNAALGVMGYGDWV